jgi:hypothetical protein
MADAEAGARSISSRKAALVGGLLGSGRDVTGSTVKMAAVLGFDNLKTYRNAVRSHNPRLAIGRRKFGVAGLAASSAPKIFDPMDACRHALRY